MKVIVKGVAEAVDKDSNPYSGKDLEKFDGISDGSCFCDYMGGNRVSAVNELSGGYLEFKYENEKLYAITEYESKRALTATELEELKNYTQGQWSDGIGEGFEQNPCNGDEDYISPWTHGQEITCFNNIKEVRDKTIKTILETKKRNLYDDEEREVLNPIYKELKEANNPHNIGMLGMDLKELYDNNYNHEIAVCRAIRDFRAAGFEVKYVGE
jgi:hypothetical protein